MKKGKKESLIHIQFKEGEALAAKRDLLKLQGGLLKISLAMGRYRILRTQELEMKMALNKGVKEVLSNMRKMKRQFPKLELPKILQHEDEIALKKKAVKKKVVKKKVAFVSVEKKYGNNIESQLGDIQRKLKLLGGQ